MDKLKELRAKQEKALKSAREKLDEIKDDTPADRAKAIGEEHDAIMADYDSIGAEIKRLERLEQAEREQEAAEEARQRQLPHRDRGDQSLAGLHNREFEDTRENRELRSELIYRHYERGESLGAEDLVITNYKFQEELAWWAYVRHGLERISPEFRKLLTFRDEKVGGEQRDFPGDAGALPTGNVGTNADGGYLAPEVFVAQVIRSMKHFAGLLAAGICFSRTTPTGQEEEWPTLDDTGNMGAKLAEGAAADMTKLAWGLLRVNVQKYTTKAFPVTSEIMQDSQIALESYLMDCMAERFARVLERDLVNDDVTQAGSIDGLVKNLTAVAARQVTVAKAQYVDHRLDNHITDLYHKIDPAYRSMGTTRLMCNDDLIKTARKIKDADNRPLWRRGDGIEGGIPNMIGGLPYIINQHMDVTPAAANKYPIVVGNFMKFYIRRARALSIRRLNELGGLSDQTIFVGFGRWGSRMLDNKAFALSKSAA